MTTQVLRADLFRQVAFEPKDVEESAENGGQLPGQRDQCGHRA